MKALRTAVYTMVILLLLGGIARATVLNGIRVVRPLLDVGGAAIREFLASGL